MLLCELGAQGEPEFIAAPLTRAIVRLSGNESALVAALGRLSWSEPRPPLVFLELMVDRYDPGALGAPRGAARDAGRPDRLPAPAYARDRAGRCPDQTLEELEPEAVFGLLCERKGIRLEDDLLAAFRDVLDEAEGGAEARGS